MPAIPRSNDRINPDANAAIKAAQAGQCRDAMKHLYDASPHQQSHNCGIGSPAARDFKLASVIVAGKCTVNAKARAGYGHRGNRKLDPEIAAGFGRAGKAPKPKWKSNGKRDQQVSEIGACTAIVGRTLDKSSVLWTVHGPKVNARGTTKKKGTAKTKAAAALRRCARG